MVGILFLFVLVLIILKSHRTNVGTLVVGVNLWLYLLGFLSIYYASRTQSLHCYLWPRDQLTDCLSLNDIQNEIPSEENLYIPTNQGHEYISLYKIYIIFFGHNSEQHHSFKMSIHSHSLCIIVVGKLSWIINFLLIIH